jgi:16S rRNA processing protein RimM
MKQGMDYLIIGRFMKPFGIHGEMKVFPFTDALERFRDLTFIFIRLSSELKKCGIEGVRYKGDKVLLKLKGYDTRNAVEQLSDEYLYIDRAHAAPIDEEEYYYYDLCACRVLTTDGEKLGSVCDIQNAGSCDVYVIRKDTAENDIFYIPAIKDVIKKIDINNKEIIIEEIEGLF